MRQSRTFWAGFGLLCGAMLLCALNPCVGIFALFYLILAFVVLTGYLVMRRRALNLRALAHRSEAAREASRTSVALMSRMLFGMAAVFAVFVAVATLVLTMLGLDPEVGGRVMFPVQLAPFDVAFDLWALSAVAAVAGAVLLVTAGSDVRRWLGSVG
ncbi:hypothetical protein H6A07_01365 [Olsenella uli]|uniref:hypothetical protein n=1 Tax=Olsenella uli TaxID=133926 RepID=UPI001956207D|nr:hypothetical protein [Olsenella uli]MBM6675396.1 hypothetical protein [Olsenella uli]